jgi:hypothetical protein
MLYALIILLFAPIFYLLLLKVSQRNMLFPWHFVPLCFVLAFSLDMVFSQTTLTRWLRCILTIVVLYTTYHVLPQQLLIRQSNIDLIARFLTLHGTSEDVIIISPWYFGISFRRYYDGSADWITVPPVGDHRIHRYDLVKEQMTLQEPLNLVYKRIEKTLESGNRTWIAIAGGLATMDPLPPVLPPAPNSPFGWQEEAYVYSWSRQVLHYAQRHGVSIQRVLITTKKPIRDLENVSLFVIKGFRADS